MDDVQKQQLFSAIRTIGAYFLGQLVAKKYIDQGIADQLVGVIVLLLPLVWGLLEKANSKRKEDARVVNAVNVGVTVADPTAPLLSPVEAKAAEASIAPVIQANKGEVK